MKKSLFLAALAVVVILSGCGKSSNIVEYNDSLVSFVKECTEANQNLYEMYQAENSLVDSIIQVLDDNITICQNSKTKAEKLWNYEKDSTLKDAVVDLLSSEVSYLQKFRETSPYRSMANLTEEDKTAYDTVKNELTIAQNSLNDKFVSLQSIQEWFANKYGLRLE